MKKAIVFWLSLLTVITGIRAADFNVSSPGYYYEINGQQPNPTLTLTRGQTYTFNISTDHIHPFAISTPDFDFNVPGVTNNNINQGTITYTVPADAPNSLLYVCSLHFFGGTINIINPPLPPLSDVKIISVSLTSSNVTLKSIGTNGWMAIPEFSSNLLNSSWAIVPDYTNTFANGTNTSVFGRLEVICGPDVFLRVKNSPAP